MSTIRLRTFGGLVPKTAPQLLPEIAAQTATNVDVRRGDLRPVNDVNTGTVIGQVWTCGAAGLTTVATWESITDGSFKITMAGTQYSGTAINFSNVESMQQVAWEISQNLTALVQSAGSQDYLLTRVYWDSTNSRFVIAVPLTVTAFAAGASGTSIAGSGYMNAMAGAATEYVGAFKLTKADMSETITKSYPSRVTVAESPLVNDTYKRLFVSGYGLPRQVYFPNSATAGYPEIYGGPLKVPTPTSTSAATAVAKSSVDWTRTWYAYYEEPDGSQVDAFTEGVNFTVATTTVGSVYHTHVAGVDGIPAKVTATANAVFVLYFDAYDAAGSLLGRVYPQHSVYKDNSDLFINGAEVTGNQVNATAATMTLTYDTSRVSDYSIDRKYVYGWLNYPFDQESAPAPESATVSVSPAQNCSVTNLGIYDPTRTYAVGDIVLFGCRYIGVSRVWSDTILSLYQCTTAATGAWDFAKWTRVEDSRDVTNNAVEIDTIRLYRTVTTSAGTQYQFVDDISPEELQPIGNVPTVSITNITVTNEGSNLVGIAVSSHQFRAGSRVLLAVGDANYNGYRYVHGSTTPTTLVIYRVGGYVAATLTGTISGAVTNHQTNFDAAGAVGDHTPQVSLPAVAHGFVAGESITITGTINYNGTFTVHASTTANEIWITASYVGETFTGGGTEKATWAAIRGWPSTSHGFAVSDVVEFANSSEFSTGGADPVGLHTVTGIATNTTLWGAGISHEFQIASTVAVDDATYAHRPSVARPYIDSIADADCGEVLATSGWAPPLDTLDGLVNAPGGFLVGFVGNTVYCSAQYLPHAWPYHYTVPHTVVGLGISGNMIVVLTEGDPYGLVGDTPGALSLIRIPLKQSCVSIQSIVSHLGKVYYASPDGIAVIAGGEGALLTGHLWTRAQWQALTPTAAKCKIHDDQLYMNFSNGNNQVTNGTFNTDLTGWSGWSGTNWEWYSGNGGTMYHNGGNTNPASQTISSLIAGRAYRVTYTVFWFLAGSGSVTVSLGGTSGTTRSDAVYEITYTEIIIAGSSNSLITFTPTSTFDACRIDNVIVELIGSTYILDLSGVAGGQLTLTDETITALYSDPVTDLLYTTAAGYLKTINGGASAKLGTWKSKDFLSPTPVRWTSGKVLAESYALGSDLVTNGAFVATLSPWTNSYGSQWAYNAGPPERALYTPGVTPLLTQSIAFFSGAMYQVVYTIIGCTAGAVQVRIGGTAVDAGDTADGTYTKYIVAGMNGTITFGPTNLFNGGVYGVTAKLVPVYLWLYADGVSSSRIPVLSARPFRFPSVTPKRRWSVQVVTYSAVNEVCLGTSMGAMTQMEQQV